MCCILLYSVIYRCAEGRRKLKGSAGLEETEYVDKHRAAAATKGQDIKKG